MPQWAQSVSSVRVGTGSVLLIALSPGPRMELSKSPMNEHVHAPSPLKSEALIWWLFCISSSHFPQSSPPHMHPEAQSPSSSINRIK